MSKSICGSNCEECSAKADCLGCVETDCCPYGKQCFIAKYILLGGMDNYLKFKSELIDEINALNIDGMEKVTELYPLVGNYVNLEYELPNGNKVKFLKDDETYLGAQIKNVFNDESICFGVIAREGFILVCKYGVNAINSEIVCYKKR